MRMKHLLIAAVLCCQAALFAADLIRNGSFETFGGDGIPAQWEFRVNNDAPVTVAPTTPGCDGEKSLRIISRIPQKTPHVYGVLSQMVKLKPNTEYTLTFSVRGQDVHDVTWAIGKGWLLRHAITGVTGEWKEHSFSFRITPEQLEGPDTCGIRLIIEGPCAELDLDDIRIEPKSGDIVTNGSFEGKPGAIPTGWSFGIRGDAEATIAVDDSVASEGKTSLRLVNKTSRNANVYGALTQTVKLFPDIDYVMRVRARGEGSGVNIAVGSKWLQRLNIVGPTGEWRDYQLEFRLSSDEVDKEGNAPLVIIIENVAPGIWLDELSITPREEWKLPAAVWQENRVLQVGKLNGAFDTLRGIPAGVPVMKLPFSPEYVVGAMPEAKNFSAKTALLTDSEGLVLLADVKDDVARPGQGEGMWKSDSIQFRIDRGGLRRPTAAESDLEVGFSVDESGRVNTWCWDAGNEPFAGKELPPDLVQAHGFRTPDGYFLAARLSWKLLGDLQKNGRFGFCIVANDSDALSHRAVYFLTPGLHDSKYSDQYVQALLDTETPAFWVSVPETPSARELGGSLLLSRAEGDVRLSVDFTDSTGKKSSRNIATVFGVKPGELIRLPFTLSLDALAKGPYTAEFLVNGNKVGTVNAIKADLYQMQLESTAALCKELERLKAAADKFYGERPRSIYISAPLDILERHLTLLRGRLEKAGSDGEKQHYAEQAAMTRQDTADALADLAQKLELLQSGKSLPGAWKFLSAPISLENGWPVATVADESGNQVRRPVVLAGYGHFTDIDRDIDLFQLQGVNVVQVEIGPSSLFPREGKSTEFEPDFSIVDSRILPLMKKAYENNVKIALLISPHYHPGWLLQKYPELASSSGFLKYEVTHPKALEMLHAYIPALVGRLKASPYAGALHSLCLTNEPVNTGCSPNNPYSVAQFSKYMEKKYGPVTAFNTATGRKFSGYEEVAKAVMSDIAARYAFYSFSRESFADWHRMLAEEIKKVWPEIPVHSKIMVFSSPFEYVAGIDPELMGEFSDYNGNDNYFYRRGPFIADWNVTAMTHEMQISAKPASVANTENHIIPDRETRPVSNDHIYSALFQQFVTGASTLTTWVWADVDYAAMLRNPKGDFVGNIRLRPGNIVAHAMAGIDGLRLAPQLRKFFDYKPEVAILYSPTSLICSPDVYRAQADALYTQLCFTGYRVRFLSERQLARGEFGNVKLLYVVGAKHISDEGLKGLERFVNAGGKIAVDSDSLTRNQYDNPVSRQFATEPVAPFKPDRLLEQIHRHVAPLPVSLAGDREGIFFRVVPEGNGNYLVNLVNYNFKPRRIQLEGKGSWFDLIGEQPFNPQLTLEPLKPQLLRFSPEK